MHAGKAILEKKCIPLIIVFGSFLCVKIWKCNILETHLALNVNIDPTIVNIDPTASDVTLNPKILREYIALRNDFGNDIRIYIS